MTDVVSPEASGPDVAMAGFVSRLRVFHIDCGAPTYRTLVATSRRLSKLYPDHLQGRNLPILSVATISEVLNGRREGLPSAEWVASFVLSCQWRAFESYARTTDPGPQTLPEWMELLRQARTAARS